MSFFKKIFGNKDNIIKIKNFYDEKETIVVYFKCSKCGEKFRSHLRKGYDFIPDYDNNALRIDKEYIGKNCYNKIQVKATFNRVHKPISQEIVGGEFIKKEDYEE